MGKTVEKQAGGLGKEAGEVKKAKAEREPSGRQGQAEMSGQRPTRIVNSSSPTERTWKYQPKQAGRLEPGAVPRNDAVDAEISAAKNRKAPVTPDGWPPISDSAAQTFGGDPSPVHLEEGRKLYRIIGNDSTASGSYWSTEPPPSTEAEWRSGSAVLDKWNGDGGYVEYTVPEGGLSAWGGTIAAQSAAVDGYALPGGQSQIWVPRGSLTAD